MMRYLSALGLALLTALPTQAAAQAKEAYLCKMSYVSPDKFIPREMAFWIGPDGQVTVFDAYIRHLAEKPIAARVTTDTAKRLTFKWSLDGMEAAKRGSTTGVTRLPNSRYTATWRKGTNLITVRVALEGFDNRPNARGKCAPIEKR
ncbi:hypothetical protein DZK27_04810 [Rhodobacteraceae bacterium 63075]|nr:hypothetical protein DZK27_04810 [Rhodobacteraceae bacterium 63075]